MEDFLNKYHVPNFMVKALSKDAKKIVYYLLDLNVMITKKYTHPRYLQEIAGIAEGAKIKKL